MERQEAIQRLSKIVGHDLCGLANKYSVTVFKGGNLNKGWAGQVIEKYLGFSNNSLQAPNAGSWELKMISLAYQKRGGLRVKEPMAVTMINPDNVERTNFEDSHLLAKLKQVVIGARIWESKQEERAIFYGVTTFDLLDNLEVYNQIKDDYNSIREIIRTQGFSALKTGMGDYIQPKPKGRGHGSTSRAFYARASFLKKFVLPLLSQEE